MNLHVRLTTFCNADCSYCSCDSGKPSDRMSIEDLEKSLDFVLSHFLARSGQKNYCGAEVIGGEVMILPTAYLKAAVDTIRKVVGKKVKHVDVGCQSNLIAPEKKIKALMEIIDDNSIGTSIDHFTNKRTINGDSNKYRELATNGADTLKRLNGGNVVGTVIVCDKDNIDKIVDEYRIAKEEKRRITVRPIFAGKHNIDYLDPKLLGRYWKELINEWFITGETVVEPLMRMTKSMIGMRSQEVGCPYWRSCSGESINLEPNGDIYVCQEMADAGVGKLGNAIEGTWDEDMFMELSRRRTNIDSECLECDWYAYCQGGCMMESKTESGSFYSKPNNCTAWKIIFKAIDDNINKYGKNTAIDWVKKVDKLDEPTTNKAISLAVETL